MNTSFQRNVLIVGVSTSDPCGVRKYSQLLSTHLGRLGFQTAVEWGDFDSSASRRSVGEWQRAVASRVGHMQADVVIFNYSAFSLSWRGIPIYVPSVIRGLQSLDVPVVTILHEFVYPWGRRGWRGFVQAASQRLVLRTIVRNSSVMIVTTPERRSWLRTRFWLPPCPSEFLPVFSTVAVRVQPTNVSVSENCVAVFGFGAEEAQIDLVTRAVAEGGRGNCHLLLIGQPGRFSPFGERWSQSAKDAGCWIDFTGQIEDEGISNALATAGFLVLPDVDGPTARRTTLAAALAHGKAVVALDGQETWDEIRVSKAVALVRPTLSSLGSEVRRLWSDAEFREALEVRARSFYRSRMSAEVVASKMSEVLRSVGPGDGARH